MIGREVINDLNNDLRLLYFKEENGYTIFKYERDLILCDPDDLSIETGTPYVVYAWGEKDPLSNQDIEYHKEYRGSIQIQLLNKIPPEVLDSNSLEIIEFLIENIVLPPTDTYYYCKLFKIPEAYEKRHIVEVNEISLL